MYNYFVQLITYGCQGRYEGCDVYMHTVYTISMLFPCMATRLRS